MLALAARGAAAAGPAQRRQAPRRNDAAARARRRESAWVNAAAQPSGSGAGSTSGRGREAGQAPAQLAAWWAPLMPGLRAVRRLLGPSLALAACTWQQPLAALVTLLGQPIATCISQWLAQQAQLYVEDKCLTMPVSWLPLPALLQWGQLQHNRSC